MREVCDRMGYFVCDVFVCVFFFFFFQWERDAAAE